MQFVNLTMRIFKRKKAINPYILSEKSLLNCSWFWGFLSPCFSALSGSLIAEIVLKPQINQYDLALLIYLIFQYIFAIFWITKFWINTDYYHYWLGEEAGKNLKIAKETHEELDSLRDAMIFDEPRGTKYWEVVLKLNQIT